LDPENIHGSSSINLGLKEISRIKEGSSKDRSLEMDRPGVCCKQLLGWFKEQAAVKMVHTQQS